MRFPFQELAELLGFELTRQQLAMLHVAQWVIILLVSLGAWGYVRRWRNHRNRTYFHRIVVGAGNVVEGGVLKLRNFREADLRPIFGDDFLLRQVVHAAHAATPGSELIALSTPDDNNLLRTKLTNGLVEASRPELVTRLAGGKTGPVDFVVSLTCEDVPHVQRKTRLIIITVDELRKYQTLDLSNLTFEHGQSTHAERAKLLKALASIWFGTDETKRSKYAWIVELQGR